MRFSLLILLLLGSFQPTFAQSREDSLRLIIKTGKEDKATARACGAVAATTSWNQPDSIFYFAQKAITLGEKLKDDTALYMGYGSMAVSYYITNKYNLAIENGLKAYRLAKKIGHEDLEASISNTLGFIYNNAGKYKEAIPFLETAVAYDRKTNQRRGLGSALNNLANAHMLLRDFKSSLVCRMEAIAIRKEFNMQSALGDSYNDLGETYLMLGNNDSAHKYLQESFNIKQKINDVEMMAVSGQNLATTLRNKKNYKEALGYLEIAERCSKEINSNQYLFQIYMEMSLCQKALGNTEKAYEFLQKHIQYKDSVITIASRRQLNELTEQFQSEKKTLEIESLKKEKEKDILLADERDKRKNSVLFLSAFILLAIGIYTFLLFKRFKLTKKQKRIIEEQKHLVEEKQKEILDSIHYAKRIQRSLMPTEKYINARLNELSKKTP